MSADPGRRICFVAALPAEAKPVRRHLRLERDNRFVERAVYSRAHLTLVISGTGREAARKTVEWSEEKGLAGARDNWINLGIGGHKTHALGQVVLASEVVEPASGKRWAFEVPSSRLWEPVRILTLAAPEFDYPENALYDMEAAGFLEAVERLAPLEQAYCFKVVSDNAARGANGINGPMVSRLLGGSLPALEHLIESLESNC